ncbi:MAG: DUF882 domain-containing protein [Methylococcales bacterium]
MKNQLSKNMTTNETNIIASRRSFLTRMAYGSLLAIGGSGIAEAAVKHVTHAASPKKDTAKHATTHVKSSLHDRLALKTASTHHDHLSHKELASNSRIHSSLHKGHDSKHHLHGDNRLASNNSNSRIHSSLHKQHDGGHHLDMQEFASRDEPELSTPLYSNTQNRFASQGQATSRFGNNIAHRSLALQNITTGDNINVTYFERGRYLPDALHEINHLYRDHLTDEVHPVDIALLDQLHDLQTTLGVNKRPIHVVCGYRSPFTNAHLRRNNRGVARNSLHMEGRAIDIRIAGVDSRTIRDAALSMAQGGVGYYPGSNFVHLDTGDVRTW